MQKSPSYSFEYIEDQSAGFPASSISYSPDYSEKKFYRLVSQDFYNTGTAYNIGLIKLFFMSSICCVIILYGFLIFSDIELDIGIRGYGLELNSTKNCKSLLDIIFFDSMLFIFVIRLLTYFL